MPFEIELDDLLDFSNNDDTLPPESAQKGVLNAYKDEGDSNLRTTASNQGYANHQVSIGNIGQLMMGIPLYKNPSIPTSQNEFLQSSLLGTALAVNDPNSKAGPFALGAGFDELVPSDIKKLAQAIGPIEVAGLLVIGDDGSIGGSSSSGGTGTSGGGSGGTAGQVPGDDNRTKVWNMLRKNGLTKEQTAGVMGNIYQESANTWDPRVVEFGFANSKGVISRAGKPETWDDEVSPDRNSKGQPGYGICQWTAPNRKQGLRDCAKRLGKKSGTIEVQITWLWEELNQPAHKAATLDPLRAVKTGPDVNVAINESAKIFLYHYEAGAGPGREPNATMRSHLPDRQGFAKEVYNYYKDKEVGGQVPSAGGGGGAPGAAGPGSTGTGISTDQVRNWWGPECYHGSLTTIILNGGAKVPVHPKVVAAANALSSAMAKAGYKANAGYTSSFNCRAITGGTKKSLHSYGIAIDINSNNNPYSTTFKTDMPGSMITAIRKMRTNNGKQVWRWGGDYGKDGNGNIKDQRAYAGVNKDTMHFEIICSPSDLDTGLDPKTLP